jgi:signal transduction histidine kinase
MDGDVTDTRTTNLRFSRNLAMLLGLGVAFLVIVVVATSVWMARKHDELAQENAHQMVVGAIAAKQEQIDGFARDYSYWDDAFHAINANDGEWMRSNIAIDGEGGAVDLAIVVEPGGAREFGWTAASEGDAESGILAEDALQTIMAALDEIPYQSRQAASAFLRSNGALWLLGIARVQPWGGVPEGLSDAQLPRMILGFEVTEDLVAAIGEPFLIDDLALSASPVADHANLPLATPGGAVSGYVTWTPPQPGKIILGQVAPPLGVALVVVAIVAFFSSRHVVRSAGRLERALSAALAADKSKTEFLTNVSHELRTPMNGVMGIGQLLRHSGLNEQQREMLEVLMTSADSQMKLIDDLMDISRIESGIFELDTAPFDPGEALAEIVAVLTPIATDKGLQLHVDMPSTSGQFVIGDRDAFKQICTNLVGNAIKFTDSGVVTVSMEQAQRLDEASIAIVVADTGPGIAPEDQQAVFERFKQVDGSTSRGAGGVGLGLSITKSLVELMNGRIELKSAPGEGAKFTVRINCEVAPSEAMNAAA